MREWTTLKDLCVNKGIQTGPFGSQLHQSDYSLDGTPVIMPVNLADGGVSEEKIARVSDEHVERLARHKVREGDLVYARRGDVGRASLIGLHEGGWLCGTGCLRATPDPNKVDSRYLFYLMSQPDVIGWFVNHAKGTTMLNLNTEILSRVPLLYEQSLEQQKRIAGILSAYDKLIENNRRQIALLEEAAQRLYKEWFVDLRFPGYETTPIIDGLPEGWRKVALESFIESHIGGGWGSETSTSDFNVEAFVVRATDISNISNGNLSLPLRWHKESNFRTRSLAEGDIVFEVSGGSKEIGVGRSMIVSKQFLKALDRPVICASFCKKVRCRSVSDAYLLYEQIQMDLTAGGIRKYEKRSAGNIINFHWEDFLKSYQVIVPDDDTLKLFSIQISCIRKQAENCKMLCMLAKEARDRLLPKLMSGEIEVV